jgi:PPIC-type PPIASE domain
MMNLKMLSSLIRKIEVILPLFILFACSESKKPDTYVAKVNDSYLTEKKLSELVDSQFVSEKNRSVVIKNWIRQEILFQEAVKEGLTETDEFKATLENTKKQLAAAMVLEKFAATTQTQFTEEELENFFEENESSFKLPFNSYFLNRIDFSNRDAAVEFRTALIMNGWAGAINEIEQDTSIVNLQDSILVSEQDIQPVRLLRILDGLYPLEISIVIPDERGYYSVVQLLDKYSAGSVPTFNAVKNEVNRRYTSALTELAIENYINELYSKSEIDLRK